MLCASRQSYMWECRSAVGADDITTFGLALVEVKLQTEHPPDWLASMMASGVCLELTASLCIWTAVALVQLFFSLSEAEEAWAITFRKAGK